MVGLSFQPDPQSCVPIRGHGATGVWLSTADLAERMGVSRVTAWRLMADWWQARARGEAGVPRVRNAFSRRLAYEVEPESLQRWLDHYNSLAWN